MKYFGNRVKKVLVLGMIFFLGMGCVLPLTGIEARDDRGCVNAMLQVQLITKPILEMLGQEHDLQIRTEVACIISMALRGEDIPNIHAEMDRWVAGAGQEKRILAISSIESNDRDIEIILKFDNGSLGQEVLFMIVVDKSTHAVIQAERLLAGHGISKTYTNVEHAVKPGVNGARASLRLKSQGRERRIQVRAYNNLTQRYETFALDERDAYYQNKIGNEYLDEILGALKDDPANTFVLRSILDELLYNMDLFVYKTDKQDLLGFPLPSIDGQIDECL